MERVHFPKKNLQKRGGVVAKFYTLENGDIINLDNINRITKIKEVKPYPTIMPDLPKCFQFSIKFSNNENSYGLRFKDIIDAETERDNIVQVANNFNK